jgi:hypothetical protein
VDRGLLNLSAAAILARSQRVPEHHSRSGAQLMLKPVISRDRNRRTAGNISNKLRNLKRSQHRPPAGTAVKFER